MSNSAHQPTLSNNVIVGHFFKYLNSKIDDNTFDDETLKLILTLSQSISSKLTTKLSTSQHESQPVLIPTVILVSPYSEFFKEINKKTLAKQIVDMNIPLISIARANNIIAYKLKIGSYTNIEQFHNVSGIGGQSFKSLETFARLYKSQANPLQTTNNIDKFLDKLNTSTEMEIKAMKIPQVADKISTRIVELRSSLGGKINDIKQLKDISWLSGKRYDGVYNYAVTY